MPHEGKPTSQWTDADWEHYYGGGTPTTSAVDTTDQLPPVGTAIPTAGGMLIVVGYDEPRTYGGKRTPKYQYVATKAGTETVSPNTKAALDYNAEKDRIERERKDDETRYNRERDAALQKEREAKVKADKAELDRNFDETKRWRGVQQAWDEKRDTLDRAWVQKQFDYKVKNDALDRDFREKQLALQTGAETGEVGGRTTLRGRQVALEEKRYEDELRNAPQNFSNYIFRSAGQEPPPLPGVPATAAQPAAGAPVPAGAPSAGFTGGTTQPLEGAPITTSFQRDPTTGQYPNGVVQSTTLYPGLQTQNTPPGAPLPIGGVGKPLYNTETGAPPAGMPQSLNSEGERLIEEIRRQKVA